MTDGCYPSLINVLRTFCGLTADQTKINTNYTHKWPARSATTCRDRSRAGRGHGPEEKPMVRALACLRREVRSGMSNSRQNLASTSPPQYRLPRGPRRAQLPSALFLQTRSSTCASPSAWVNSTTSACSCSSRPDGPDRPATSAVLPASMNSAFHRPIDCSETFSFRAA
jgi:hypothetical protein